ncbi:MAG: helix-turn-helix domain-containing protein [Nitriliruptorales bacterium]|nr:helix-turn-helix domain-containing protein [Nitriliruptorales bacterium]
MRRHGWSGQPPADEDEARERILSGARRVVDRDGAHQASLSDVAAEVGVTRQTVYRYFPSTASLFSALAVESADEFIDRIIDHIRRIEDPVDALVEGLAFGIEAVPDERYIGLLLRTGGFTQGIISAEAMDFGRQLLQRTSIDWDALAFDDEDRDGLVELMLRLIQSFSVTPAAPSGKPRRGASLRSFLDRWLAPAIRDRALSSTDRRLSAAPSTR